MNLNEFDNLKKIEKTKETVISAKDILNDSLCDRTLLYGYTCDRSTFHVYLKEGLIHTITYKIDYSGEIGNHKPVDMKEICVESNRDYIPDKRLYPECCDFYFCKLLKEKNIYLPFTTFNHERPFSMFYGFTLEDME